MCDLRCASLARRLDSEYMSDGKRVQIDHRREESLKESQMLQLLVDLLERQEREDRDRKSATLGLKHDARLHAKTYYPSSGGAWGPVRNELGKRPDVTGQSSLHRQRKPQSSIAKPEWLCTESTSLESTRPAGSGDHAQNSTGHTNSGFALADFRK
jgi:hypothetical protein